MPLDFRRIGTPQRTTFQVDPIALFRSLRVTDTTINDLWLAQGDALREWHNVRTNSDVAITLNTGAGKTLVGLLIAQSLVNETGGRVLYACSSIQLVEQTKEKAEGYGLPVTTYYRQIFSNDLFQRGMAPCITTYQAIFNGMSRFLSDDIVALVLDDAHTAENIIRGCFTLEISREIFPGVYTRVVNLFRDYFERIGLGIGFTGTIEGNNHEDWFVPPFVVKEHFAEVTQALVKANFQNDVSTKFAWAHIQDKIDLCAMIVSAEKITISPPMLPTATLPYFETGKRRVYLSATMSTHEAFLKTFGIAPQPIISPQTTAGECERLILIPALNPEVDNDVEVSKQLIAEHKTLILVPNNIRANIWLDVADKASEDVAEELKEFKEASDSRALIVVARYDGIDLPGDTCRLLVIDGRPSGVHPLEKYLWSKVGIGKLLRSIVASRVVQSFGRISRGMSDYGVIIVTSEELVDWILSPDNQAMLPRFLVRQINLGIQISKNTSGEELREARDACMNREESWLDYYQQHVMNTEEDLAEVDNEPDESEREMISLASAEALFGKYIWERQYRDAARTLHEVLDLAFKISKPTGAWYALWLGFTYQLLRNEDQANNLYLRAHRAAKNIPPIVSRERADREIIPQIREIVQIFYNGVQINEHIINEMDREMAFLLTAGDGSYRQVEEAIRALGEYLGFEASRPDNEFGVGPDVLWIIDDEIAMVIEVKSNKDKAGSYRKEEIGQLHNSIQWVKQNKKTSTIIPVIAGPILSISHEASPPDGGVIIEIEEFSKVAKNLRAVLHDICANITPVEIYEEVEDRFMKAQLTWPQVFENMTKHPMV